MVGNDEKQAWTIAKRWFILDDNKQKYINLIKNSKKTEIQRIIWK